MSVKATVKRQHENLVNSVAKRMAGFSTPREGWIKTVRTALGMSGPQLAKRLGVTKAAIYQAERREPAGEITLKHMQTIAKGMGCKFVYAIIPEGSVDDIVRAQARKKAEENVGRANTHMALELQSLPASRNREEVERLIEDLVRHPPPNFWDEA